MTTERTTKYAVAVREYVQAARHATNAEILQHVQMRYPGLSATTIHRITTRMIGRGELAEAPPAQDNAARFDAMTIPHDHFQCVHCDHLRDIVLPQAVFVAIQEQMGDCKLTGRLTIKGSCNKCIQEEV